jgi:HTH-type transcriptional regulator / antitoxin HipB
MPAVDTLRDLTLVAKGRRLALHLTQAEVADRAKVSRQWLNEFERGKPTAEIQLVLRLLSALDLRLSVDVPGEAEVGGAGRTGRGRVNLDVLLDAHRRP